MNNKKMIEAVQAVLDRSVEQKNVAGMNALILKDGEELGYAQAGYADVLSKKPFNRDTIMRCYSMSKPITGAAVMILVQRGIISLSEPVCKYLPGFKNQFVWADENTKVPVKRLVCIKDLLSMTSGLPYGDPNENGHPAAKKVQEIFNEVDKRLYSDNPVSTVELANALGESGLMFSPGEHWQYGTSADILGAVVEVASGMKYGEFLKKEIFEPLGMNDTGFFVEADKHDRLASVYEKRNGELELFETNNLGIKYTMDSEPAFQSGGAGLASTLDDYARFAKMMINGGSLDGKEILNENIVKYATHGRLLRHAEEQFQREWDNHAGYSYGCLMQHMVDPQKAYYMTWMDEYGWDGWLGTYFANSPSNKVTILLGMQISNPEGNHIFEKVRNVVGQYLA